MSKFDREDTVPVPIEAIRKLTELARNLEGQTLIVVRTVPEQKSMKAFLAEYARTGKVNVACSLVGLPKTTYYRYQRRNPEFRRRCLEIKEAFRNKAEKERIERMKQEIAARLHGNQDNLAARFNEVVSLLSAVGLGERKDESDEP